MTTVTKPYQDFVNNIDVVDAVKINAQLNALYNFLNAANIDFTNLAASAYSTSSLASTLVERDANQNIAVNFVKGNQNPNLLFNPSARLGLTGWTANGAGNNFSANFGVGAEGEYWTVSSGSATSAVWYLDSAKIPVSNGISLNISGEIFTAGQTAGSTQIEIHAFSNTDADLGVVANAAATNGQGWTKYSASGTTPANTSYVRARLIFGVGSVSTNTACRKLKVEAGTVSTTFSDDNTLNTQQYGSVLGLAQVLSGGYKVQSGSGSLAIATAGSQVIGSAINFPIVFSAAPLVLITLRNVSSSNATYCTLQVPDANITASSFTPVGNSGVAQTLYFDWIAIGT